MKHNLQLLLQVVLILFVLIAPCIQFSYSHRDLSFLITSIVFSLPLCSLLLFIKGRFLKTVILFIAMVLSLIEIAMVVDFNSFVIAGNILAILGTDFGETKSFLENNLTLVLFFIPVIICFLLVHHLWNTYSFSKKKVAVLLASSLSLAISFILYKQIVFYENKLTYRYYVENRVFNRPPYNIPYQISNVIKIQHRRRAISESNHFTFSSIRNSDVKDREIYVLAIGESMRYDNISLNGTYFRHTTPELESFQNLVSYSNYYSAACLTMFSVPQILTRATPKTFDISYKEKSVFLPFKENGFKTFGVVCNNLLGYEEYLTAGMDSLFRVNLDKEIPVVIDSLSGIYQKTFFIIQFLGCHSYYYNYESDFDLFHPNINSDSRVKSDSLYINAYDNTILYADHILSEIIRSIDKPETVSSFLFTSDHGENITSTGGGHGGDCRPLKTEYHVPFICWYSDSFRDLYPEKVENLKAHRNDPISSDNVFYSVCDMGDISLAEEYTKNDYSVFSDQFEIHRRFVLVPDGINLIEVE